MRTTFATALVILLALALPAAAGDPPKVGDKAPDFTLADQSGETRSLSATDGKIRVLEWINPDCPFVQRHYAAGTMKKLAERYGDRNVVWMAVNSTNYMDAEANAKYRAEQKLPYPILVDQDGTVGRLYGAATTPHMYIIDADGTLVYEGAIDDDPRGSKGGDATNYVAAALDEVLAGRSVSTAETKPYGCSVKYKK